MLRYIAIGAAPILISCFGVGVASADVNPKGVGNDTIDTAADPKVQGQPSLPNGFGAATSQRAVFVGDIGEHSSAFAPGPRNLDGGGATGRQGVGNVARTDGVISNSMGIPNPGDAPGDHGALILQVDDGVDGTNIANPPGNTRPCTTCR